MKKLLLAFIVCVLTACHQNLTPQLVDDTAGEPLVTINGDAFRFADYRGKWIVVNYWASWCGPCRAELPDLNVFYAQHQAADAIVLGVNNDHVDANATKKIADDFQIKFPVIIDDPGPKLGLHEPVRGFPTTYLINPDGYLVQRFEGGVSKGELERAMGLNGET